MLIYWIRDVAKYRKRTAEKDLNKIGRLVYETTGTSKSVMTFLTIFYIILVIDFMVLYVYFFKNVAGDPSFAG